MNIYFWKAGDYYNHNPPLISSFSKIAKGNWLLFLQLKYNYRIHLRTKASWLFSPASCSVHDITTYLKLASVVFQQVKEKSMLLSYHSQALKDRNWQMLLPKNIELFLVAWECNMQRHFMSPSFQMRVWVNISISGLHPLAFGKGINNGWI